MTEYAMNNEDDGGFGDPPPPRPGGGHPLGRNCRDSAVTILAVVGAVTWFLVGRMRLRANKPSRKDHDNR